MYSITGYYNYSADYWNKRKTGTTVEMASVDVDSKYGYIEIVSGEFYMKAIDNTGTNTLNISMNTIIVKGNNRAISDSIGRVSNAFIKIEYSSSNKVTVSSGFGSAAQTDISGDSNCDLVFKAYTN